MRNPEQLQRGDHVLIEVAYGDGGGEVGATIKAGTPESFLVQTDQGTYFWAPAFALRLDPAGRQ